MRSPPQENAYRRVLEVTNVLGVVLLPLDLLASVRSYYYYYYLIIINIFNIFIFYLFFS